jgi:2-dehydropantoate 2-reductase
LVSPLLGKNTFILTLQNGLGNEELLASLFGEERILGGVAFLCSNRGIPGVVHHLGEGRILLGEYARTDTARADKFAAMFMDAGIECKAVPDLKRARWEKLVWNIPFNGLCALMLKPVDVVLSLDATRKLIINMMGEVIAGGNAQGLMKDMPNSLADKMVVFSENLGAYKPSMMIDRIEGRSLELDAIFGVPLIAAANHGVSMPRVEELHALLQLVEQG